MQVKFVVCFKCELHFVRSEAPIPNAHRASGNNRPNAHRQFHRRLAGKSPVWPCKHTQPHNGITCGATRITHQVDKHQPSQVAGQLGLGGHAPASWVTSGLRWLVVDWWWLWLGLACRRVECWMVNGLGCGLLSSQQQQQQQHHGPKVTLE